MSKPNDRMKEKEAPPSGSAEKLSRRELLKGVGLAGAAAVMPRLGVAPLHATSPAQPPAALVQIRQRGLARRRVYENLTAAEARTLEVMLDHLIPPDEHGPGAVESGALNFIDQGLGGAMADQREAYRTGLGALDRYCRYSRGGPFTELTESDQISVLMDLEGGSATGSNAGFDGSSGAFFGMVKGHTWQGMFGDPYYGGNVDYEGWKLLGYPGVRTVVTPEIQEQLEAGTLAPDYHSAYDSDFFEKAVVLDDRRGGKRHGD